MYELILSFLAALHCVPTASVVLTPGLDRPARYAAGVISIQQFPVDAGVLTHEMWHACQDQKLGPAGTAEENARREVEARRVELMFREWYENQSHI